MHVILARPSDLHGRAGPFRNLDRFGNEILLGAAAKSAAEKRSVYANLFRLQSGDFRAGHLHESLELRGRVNVASVRSNVRSAIHRFHGGVREERDFVGGFDFLGSGGENGVGVTILARDGAGFFRGRQIKFSNRIAGVGSVRAFVPGDLQRAAAFHGGPGVIRDHGDAGRDLQDLFHAANRLCFRIVKALHLSAENRTARHDGVLDIWQAHINAEACFAVYFRRCVEAFRGLADVLVVFRILQLGIRGNGELRGSFRQCSVTQTLARGVVYHGAVFHVTR